MQRVYGIIYEVDMVQLPLSSLYYLYSEDL